MPGPAPAIGVVPHDSGSETWSWAGAFLQLKLSCMNARAYCRGSDGVADRLHDGRHVFEFLVGAGSPSPSAISVDIPSQLEAVGHLGSPILCAKSVAVQAQACVRWSNRQSSFVPRQP